MGFFSDLINPNPVDHFKNDINILDPIGHAIRKNNGGESNLHNYLSPFDANYNKSAPPVGGGGRGSSLYAEPAGGLGMPGAAPRPPPRAYTTNPFYKPPQAPGPSQPLPVMGAQSSPTMMQDPAVRQMALANMLRGMVQR